MSTHLVEDVLAASDIGYRGASRSIRNLAKWNPKLKTPDKALSENYDELLARVYDLARNNPLVIAALRSVKDAYIGHQWMPSLRPDYKTLGITKEAARDFAAVVERRFLAWANDPHCWLDASARMNLPHFMRSAVGSEVMSGDVIVTREYRRDRLDGLSGFGTCFQLIDPDRVMTPPNSTTTAEIRRGVELNRFGETQAFHIRYRSLGDITSNVTPINEFARVPVYQGSTLNVFHLFETERGAMQTRGISRVAACVQHLKMSERMSEAQLEAAVVASIIGLYIKSPFGQKSALDAIGGSGLDGAMDYVEAASTWAKAAPIEFDGVRVPALFPGEDIGAVTNNSAKAVDPDFQKHVDRRTVAGIGAGYSSATQDYTNVSYSSLKKEAGDQSQRSNSYRAVILNPLSTLMMQSWLDEAVVRGIISPPSGVDYFRDRALLTQTDWIGGPEVILDGVKEATEDNMRLSSKTMSLRTVAHKQGKTLDQLLDEIQESESAMKERGLTSDYISRQSIEQTEAVA